MPTVPGPLPFTWLVCAWPMHPGTLFPSTALCGTPLKCQDHGLWAGHSSPRAAARPSNPFMVAFPLQGHVAEQRSTGHCLRRALCLFLTRFVATQPPLFICGCFYAIVSAFRGWDGECVCCPAVYRRALRGWRRTGAPQADGEEAAEEAKADECMEERFARPDPQRCQMCPRLRHVRWLRQLWVLASFGRPRLLVGACMAEVLGQAHRLPGEHPQ